MAKPLLNDDSQLKKRRKVVNIRDLKHPGWAYHGIYVGADGSYVRGGVYKYGVLSDAAMLQLSDSAGVVIRVSLNTELQKYSMYMHTFQLPFAPTDEALERYKNESRHKFDKRNKDLLKEALSYNEEPIRTYIYLARPWFALGSSHSEEFTKGDVVSLSLKLLVPALLCLVVTVGDILVVALAEDDFLCCSWGRWWLLGFIFYSMISSAVEISNSNNLALRGFWLKLSHVMGVAGVFFFFDLLKSFSLRRRLLKKHRKKKPREGDVIPPSMDLFSDKSKATMNEEVKELYSSINEGQKESTYAFTDVTLYKRFFSDSTALKETEAPYLRSGVNKHSVTRSLLHSSPAAIFYFLAFVRAIDEKNSNSISLAAVMLCAHFVVGSWFVIASDIGELYRRVSGAVTIQSVENSQLSDAVKQTYGEMDPRGFSPENNDAYYTDTPPRITIPFWLSLVYRSTETLVRLCSVGMFMLAMGQWGMLFLGLYWLITVYPLSLIGKPLISRFSLASWVHQFHIIRVSQKVRKQTHIYPWQLGNYIQIARYMKCCSSVACSAILASIGGALYRLLISPHFPVSVVTVVFPDWSPFYRTTTQMEAPLHRYPVGKLILSRLFEEAVSLIIFAVMYCAGDNPMSDEMTSTSAVDPYLTDSLSQSGLCSLFTVACFLYVLKIIVLLFYWSSCQNQMELSHCRGFERLFTYLHMHNRGDWIKAIAKHARAFYEYMPLPNFALHPNAPSVVANEFPLTQQSMEPVQEAEKAV